MMHEKVLKKFSNLIKYSKNLHISIIKKISKTFDKTILKLLPFNETLN
jgi:hypothetical protein